MAIQKETAYKTDPVTPNMLRLPFSTETLTKSIKLSQSDTIRSDRNPTAPSRDNIDVAGGINFNLGAFPGEIFEGILGLVATTGAGPYTHAFSVGNSIPSFVIEKGFPDISQYFKYNGVKFSRFSITATPSGTQKATIDVMGAECTPAATPFDATVTDLGVSEFDGFSVSSIQEGGAAITGVTEVRLTVDNNPDGDTFEIAGGGVRAAINEGLVHVTGTLSGIFENLTLYNKAKNLTESSLKLVYTKGTGDGSAGNEYLEFYLPELVFALKDPAIEGPKGIFYSLDYEAYYANDANATALLITLKNTQATI